MADYLRAMEEDVSAVARSEGNSYLETMNAEVEDEKSQFKQSASIAVQSNPDEVARSRRVAGLLGTTSEAVRVLPKEHEQLARVQELDRITSESPITRAMFLDPEYAKLLHDDVDNMSRTETLINSFRRGVPALKANINVMGIELESSRVKRRDSIDGKRGFRINPLTGQPELEAITVTDALTTPIFRGGDDYLYKTDDERKSFRELQDPKSNRVISDAIQSLVKNQADRAAIPLPPVVDRVMNEKTFGGALDEIAGDPIRFIAAIGGESLVTSAPGLIAAIPAGIIAGPGGSAGAMGANSFLTSYASSIVKGMQDEGIDVTKPESISEGLKDPEKFARIRKSAFAYASVVAGFDTISGGMAGKTMLPSAVVNKLTGKPLTRELANIGVQVPIQGALGGAGDAGGALASGKEIAPGEVLAEIFGESFGAPAEVMSASVKRIYGLRAERKALEVKSAKAEQDAEILTQLARSSAESKLNPRDPVAYQEFLKTVDDSTEIYISGKELFQSGAIEQLSELSPSIAAQYKNAYETGGDVIIPVAEFIAKIGGSEYGQGLIQNIRVGDPNAMSLIDAQDNTQNGSEELKTEVDRVLGKGISSDDFQQSRDAVEKIIFDEFASAGRYSKAVNAKVSFLAAEKVAVKARKEGITPEEYYRKHALTVTDGKVKPDGKTSQGKTFSQGSPLDARESALKKDILEIADIPEGTKINISKEINGKIATKLVSANKAVLSASQRDEKLNLLKGCL